MLKLLFLIADAVWENGGAGNAARVDVEPRWRRCREQLWEAAGMGDLPVFYVRTIFYGYRPGKAGV